ncbi:MAG: PLD nuclease N-terminal domain-containing protein [Pseudomonadota bacterium]
MHYGNLVLLAVALLLPMAVTFWAIVHVLTVARFKTPLSRFGWLAAVTLLPVLGAIAYLVAGRAKATPQKTEA